jgi:PadR family transcriptional regulator, regulatory protein PadR
LSETDLCATLLAMTEVRMTTAVLAVLRAFLDDISQPRYGYELMQLTALPSSKVYPILARLQRVGWLTRAREDAELVRALGELDPTQADRRARVLYQLSPVGIQAAREAVGLTE